MAGVAPVITGLERTREDGKVIDERMTLDHVIRSGWSPSRVVSIQWRWQGERLQVAHPLGILVTVVPGGQYLAALLNTDDSGFDASLYVIPGNGERWLKIPDRLQIGGAVECGTYSWFESDTDSRPGVFRCVFSCARKQSMHHVDIDAATGDILSVRATR